MSRVKKLFSGSAILLIISAVLFGRLAYMNIRSDDPMPYGFSQYEEAAFLEAQASGATILVDVYASWCPTCLSQHKVLEGLLQDPSYTNVIGFRVDYEGDPDFVRQHKVPAQSTIIMFNGEDEISRTVGVTSDSGIRAQVNDAVAKNSASIS